MTQSLKHKTIQGLSWSVITQIIRQIFNFVFGIILARLLSPREFGIVGMLTIFTAFANLFLEFGLGAAIIHKQDIKSEQLSSIFWLNIMFGILLTIIIIALSPMIASFYKEPILQPIAILISLNYFIGSFNIVPNALLNKYIDFKRLAKIEFVAISISGIFSIILALNNYGVWSLAWQSVIYTLITVIVMWLLSPWRPKLCFNFSSIKEMFQYSINLLGFNALNYWNRNFDNLLIGRYISSYALGIYDRAYQLMLMPLNQVSNVVTSVMFPILSTIKNEKPRVKQIYLRSTRLIALITFPLLVGLFMVSDSFIITVFGEKWKEVIPVLRVLCLAGMTQSVGTTVGWIYNSQGRTDVQFKWGIITFIIRITAFIIGLRWGILGIAVAYLLSGYLILWYPSWAIPGKLIGLRFSEMMENLSKTFYCAILMGIFIWVLGIVLPANLKMWQILLIKVSWGSIFYFLLIHLVKLESYLEAKQLIKDKFINNRQ
jgi:O-antigen/teichoic acid export membrane protein